MLLTRDATPLKTYALFLSLLLCALSFLIPNFTQPWLSFYREMLAYGFVLFLYAACSAFFDKKIIIPRPLWPLGLCALIVLARYAGGMILFHGDVVLILLFLLGLAVAFGCGTKLALPAARYMLKALAATLLATAIISALLAFLQWFGVVPDALVFFILPSPIGDRVWSNMGQPNHLGTLLVMGFAAALYLYRQRVIHTPLLLLCTVIPAAALVLTGSNAGLLSALAVAVFYGVMSYRFQTSNRTEIRAVILWCAVVCLGFWYLSEIRQLLYFSSGHYYGLSASSTGRMVIYRQALAGLSQHPWLGYGWLNTLQAIQAGAAYVNGSEPATYSHNMVLDLLIWNGIPAGLVIAGALLYWGISRYFVQVNRETFWVCMITLPFWIHSMTEFPFAFAYFAFPIAVLCGYIERAGTQRETVLFRVNKKIVHALILCTAIFGGFIVHAYITAEQEFLLVRMYNKGFVLSRPYTHKKIMILDQLDDFIAAMEPRSNQDMTPTNIALMKKVISRFSSPIIESRYLAALIITKQYDLYQKELREISNIHDSKYAYEFNQFIAQNSAVPEEIKIKTAQILHEKIKAFLAKQNAGQAAEQVKE